MSTQSTKCPACPGKTFQRTAMSLQGTPRGRRSASQALAWRGRRGYPLARTHREPADMSDLPYKPDWIATVRKVVMPLLPQAMDEGTMLLQALSIYQHTDELGGPSMSRVLNHMGAFRQAVGVETLPEEIEGHGWQLYLF